MLILMIFGLLFTLFAARRMRTRLSLGGAMLILAVAVGCGGGYSSTTSSTRTPAASYPITVTGTSGGVSRSAVVTVAVN